MLTKKQLIERLKDVPDDALIGLVQCTGGVRYGVYWGKDTEISFMSDFLHGAAYVPLTNKFSLDDLRK